MVSSVSTTPSNRHHCIICDLDGTLALIDHRDPFDASTCELDELNEAVSEVLKRFARDTEIILVSGRQNQWRKETKRWLTLHDIPYSQLFMRAKGDFRKDTVVKAEVYRQHIQPIYDVWFVLEDRNQVVDMWRQLGLPCFQVAPGDF